MNISRELLQLPTTGGQLRHPGPFSGRGPEC